MSEIRVKDNESIDSALRRFKRSCAKSGVLAEVRKREHYEKPSVKRRKKLKLLVSVSINNLYLTAAKCKDLMRGIIAPLLFYTEFVVLPVYGVNFRTGYC